MSKTFTADAVLELAGQGRLSLDEPLARYVPDIPHGDRITVRDLLGMRAGVYDFTADPGFLAHYDADPTLPGWTPDDVLIRREMLTLKLTGGTVQIICYCSS